MGRLLECVGYDKDGIQRVYAEIGQDDDEQKAIVACKAEAAKYILERPDTGPLSEWKFELED